MNVLIWVFLAIMFVILELITTSFFLVWFGVGSVVACILNYMGFDFYVQFTAFVIVSLVLLLTTRKFALKITPEPSKKAAFERLIGEDAVVVKKLSKNEAVIKVLGEKWSAYIPPEVDVDDTVKITGIDSIKLITKRMD